MTIIRRLGLDFAYTFLGLPLAVVGFSLLVSLFAASIGTAVIFIGIPLLALTLLLARGFADLERVRLLQLTGRAVPRPRYAEAPEGAGWFGRITAPIRQGQSWLDLLYAIVNLPIATITFVLPVVWWAMALGGLTYWYWGRFIPYGDSNDIVIETIMGTDTAHNRTLFNTIIGAVALLTLYAVQRGSAALQASFAQTLLTRLAVVQGRIQKPITSPAEPTALGMLAAGAVIAGGVGVTAPGAAAEVVALSNADDGNAVQADAGDLVRVRLTPIEGGGERWTWSLPTADNPDVLTQTSGQATPDGGAVASFEITAPGGAVIIADARCTATEPAHRCPSTAKSWKVTVTAS